MTLQSIEIKPCTFEAAKYAVINWHYSKTMPVGRLTKFGVWENGKFIGCVIYGKGSNRHFASPYGLNQHQVCELVRVALNKHETPVTQIVAETLRQLKKSSPGLEIVISYADPGQGHQGGIYKAGNWIFTGLTPPQTFFLVHGKVTHPRTVGSWGITHNVQSIREKIDPNASAIFAGRKLRFVYPLTKHQRRKVLKIALPYPNAIEGLEASHLGSTEEVQVRFLPTAPKEDHASR